MTRPDPDRFERLVHELHGPVFRSARRLCADDAAAADVVQDVFVRVWEGKVALAELASERATLCWLAARLAANHRRAARRRHDHEENAMHLRPGTDAPDPVHATATADLHATVQGLVAALPAELRVPLLMRHQDALPLAAIGDALRLPTSTVHDRIRDALERLRGRLARSGHSVGGAALPAMVAAVDDAPAPLGLESRLLGVASQAPVAASGAKALLVGAAVAVLAFGVVLANDRFAGGAEPPRVGSAPSVAAVVPSAQDPVPPAPPPPPQGRGERTAAPAPATPPLPAPATPAPDEVVVLATLTGTVRDAEAWPVAGATVQVVAGGGFKPFALGEPTVTDARGAFTVNAASRWLHRVDVASGRARMTVRLVVREHGRELLTTPDLVVPRAPDADALELVLPESVGSASSRYELAVAVRDEAGVPVPDVQVVLYGGFDPSRYDRGDVLGEAKSGAAGRALLRGRGLGAKWLFADGRPLRRASWLAPCTIARAGTATADVVLPRGGEIDVVVTTVSGRALAQGQPVVVDPTTGLDLAHERRGDTFRFFGALDRPYVVRAWGDGRCSRGERRGVRAGGGPVTLTLKDQDDERDVGDHMAELHGELVDAATGEVLSYGPFELDVMPVVGMSAVGDGSSLPSDGIEPPAPAQRAADGTRRTRFHVTGLGAGRWAVVASLAGRAVATEVVTLGEREVRTGLRIALVPQCLVRGRVVDGAGAPVRGAHVFAVGHGSLADGLLEAWRAHRDGTASPGARMPSFTPLGAWTRPDGTFVVDQIPPGLALRLVARHDAGGFVVAPLAPLRAGEVLADFDLKLAPR